MTTTAPNGTTSSSTLSPWAGGYVTDMLGKTQALANEGYQMYDGPLTAGASSLQQQAFQGLGSLSGQPGIGTPYTAGSFNSGFNPNTFSSNLPGTSSTNPYGVGSLTDYMNPYIQGVLDPQIREAQRAAKIAEMSNADRFAKAGAYGGSRQAIMDAELQRNLLQSVGDMTGKAYSSAFDNAQNQQYKAAQLGMDAQKASEQSRQFGANLGLDTFRANEAAQQQQGILGLDAAKTQSNLYQQMLDAGKTQRDIEQQGLTADYGEFLRQQEHPYDQLKFMREMITGMPISTQTSTPNPASSSQQWAGLIADLAELFKQ